MSIAARLKYILTGDAGKLCDAGFINSCDGTLTNDGRSALWLIVMQKYNAEFVKAAEAVLAEREAEKNL